MAKSIRSKVKKRFRTVKRGVLKKELSNPDSKLGKRETQKEAKLAEALSGHLKPGVQRKNAFRSDDPDAEIPQHSFRQGPDFRSDSVPDAGYAVVGSNRPKMGKFGGDAPTGRPTPKSGTAINGMDVDEIEDQGVARILRTTECIVPFHSSGRTRKRLKMKSGTNHDAPFRWV